MNYTTNSYKIQYQNSYFDSALELTWFLFFAETINATPISQPFYYKSDLGWYPDMKFGILCPTYKQIYAEVKPLNRDEFITELDMKKYKYQDNIVCILGKSNTEYLFLKEESLLMPYFDEHVLPFRNKWDTCTKNALEFAQKYGSKKANDLPERANKISFGKYAGLSLREIKERDLKYYQWLIDEVL